MGLHPAAPASPSRCASGRVDAEVKICVRDPAGDRRWVESMATVFPRVGKPRPSATGRSLAGYGLRVKRVQLVGLISRRGLRVDATCFRPARTPVSSPGRGSPPRALSKVRCILDRQPTSVSGACGLPELAVHGGRAAVESCDLRRRKKFRPISISFVKLPRTR